MFYQYKVTYYNEYEDKDIVEEGVVYGIGYSEAAKHLKDYYGSDLVDMYLQEWDAQDALPLDIIKKGFQLT